MKKREITIPTLTGLMIAISGLLSGLWLLKGQVNYRTNAAGEETPYEVRVSNVTDKSFTVTWLTQKAVSGFIQYKETNSGSDLVVSDERDQQKGSISKYFTHIVTVRSLKTETNYEFKIGSESGVFGDNDKPYAIQTTKDAGNPPAADVAYGQVITGSGEPAEGAIVYLQTEGMSPQATIVKTSGSWVIPISTSRSSSTGGYFVYDQNTTPLDLWISGGPMGMSRVKVATGNDSPVQTITLGQDYNLLDSNKGPIESKFLQEDKLKLLTPNTGERINSTRPEIVGQAPAGTDIQIEIHSDILIQGNTQADEEGKFSYSLPSELTPGEHTISITAIIDGVKKTITRSFVVYAAGESSLPAFTASPSATRMPTTNPTVTPTVKPSPTLKPSPTNKIVPTAIITGTPKATPTIKPSPTPTNAPTPTPVTSLPNSGYDMPTWSLLVLGMAMIGAGGWWYKKAV